ncbi:MAG: hypothetical protein ACE5JB_03040 [bacterium]
MNSQSLRSKPSWWMSSDEIRNLDPVHAELSALGCAVMRYIESKKPPDEK